MKKHYKILNSEKFGCSGAYLSGFRSRQGYTHTSSAIIGLQENDILRYEPKMVSLR